MVGPQESGQVRSTATVEFRDDFAGIEIVLRSQGPALEEQLEFWRQVRNSLGRTEHGKAPRHLY